MSLSANDVVAANWRALIKPRRIERDADSAGNYGKFVVRPLERGFGITLGNSLRRVLLSSLQGAAVNAVRIEGVQHEFASVPGVTEDMTEVLLNIKGLRIRTQRSEPFTGTIDVHGGEDGCVVTGADIRFDAAAEVINPEHVLCTLAGKREGGGHDVRFFAELSVAMGKGYIPVERNGTSTLPLGTIPLDAAHSPVTKVKYTVTNARVGNRTDYDKLTLEVWTNGSVTPEDAVAYAAKILKEQFTVFINFAESDEPVGSDDRPSDAQVNENLYKPVAELDLSVRSANCLQNAGIEFIWQLVERTEPEMLKTKNFGRKSLNEIKELLSDMGLSLGMKLHNFPKNR